MTESSKRQTRSSMPENSDALEFDGDLAAEIRLRSLVNFIPALSPRYMSPVHLAELLLRFELAADGVPQRVCCSAPPRHAKTESVLHVPAFVLRRKPEMTLSYSTYGDRLSRSKSRKARRLAEIAGVEVAGSGNEWRAPGRGGGFGCRVCGPRNGGRGGISKP